MDGKPEAHLQMTPAARSPVHFISHPEDFSYNEFFSKYMIGNAPCVFSSAFTQSWGSRRSWVTSDNKPNWDHLLQNFGDAIVPVANCDVKEYNANPKEQIPLREYISYWRACTENGCRASTGCLYLKDWHMRRAFPEQDAYETPVYFSSDWLNEYWDAIAVDDYRFVYMGPAGSWTPFHADVFRSYSWSANICGRKRWLLYPPGQEEYLRDCHGCLPYDVTSSNLQDAELYPNYGRCQGPLEVIQEAGEVIFVPSGWHHQVYNMEDTISINHNWVNGCNVSVMWSFLQAELAAVQKEIAEWKESMEGWDQHCQVIMKSCSGIDYKEFYTFLSVIAERRIRALQSAPQEVSSPGTMDEMTPGPRHALYDIRKIADILVLMINNEDFNKLNKETLNPPPRELLSRLQRLSQ